MSGEKESKEAKMQPLEMFQLHWSHYCHKVRFAAAVKKLPLREIEVFAFQPQREVRELKGVRKLYPILRDRNTGTVLGDSTPILAYLDKQYPHAPRLFPDDERIRQQVIDTCVECDSTFGLAARRIAYTRVVVEHPQLLWQLFVEPHVKGVDYAVLRVLGGLAIGTVLSQRFRMPWNVEERQFDVLERALDKYTERLRGRRYLYGDSITAADISLVSLTQPLRIVPFVMDQPRWRPLFVWAEGLLREHGMPTKPVYEQTVLDARRRRASRPLWNALVVAPIDLALRGVEFVGDTAMSALGVLPRAPVLSPLYTARGDARESDNDHQPVTMLSGPLGLLYTLVTAPYLVGVKMRRDLRIHAKL